MTKEELVTKQVQELYASIRRYISSAPLFQGDAELCKDIGSKFAQVESTLCWNFNCPDLALPYDFPVESQSENEK